MDDTGKPARPSQNNAVTSGKTVKGPYLHSHASNSAEVPRVPGKTESAGVGTTNTEVQSVLGDSGSYVGSIPGLDLACRPVRTSATTGTFRAIPAARLGYCPMRLAAMDRDVNPLSLVALSARPWLLCARRSTPNLMGGEPSKPRGGF